MKDWLRVIGFVLIVIALGIAYGLISGPANAQETEPTYYLKLDLGAGFPTDTSNDDPVEYNEHPSPLILGAYGIDWKYVAAEIEGGYRYTPTHNMNAGTGPTFEPECECFKSEENEGDGYGHVISLMANVVPHYTFDEYDVEAYVLAGGGGASVRAFGESDQNFAWQVGAGFFYAIDELWDAHAGYRFFNVLETEHDGLDADYNSHEFIVGFRRKL